MGFDMYGRIFKNGNLEEFSITLLYYAYE